MESKSVLETLKKLAEAKNLNEFIVQHNYFTATENWPHLSESERSVYLTQVIAWLSEFLKDEPNNVRILETRGKAFTVKGEYKNAIKDLKKWVKLEPGVGWAYTTLAYAQRMTGEIEDAIATLESGGEIVKDFGWLFLDLGDYYKLLDRKDKALGAYEKSTLVEHDFSWGYFEQAKLYQELDKYKEAKENYKKVLDINNSLYLVERAEPAYKEMEARLENNAYRSISKLIDQVKTALEVKGDVLTHYTGLSTAKALILKESRLRLSEATYLNDTSEGKPLFDFLDLEEQVNRQAVGFASVYTLKPFIGSYVSPSLSNNLTLWRMYGKEGKEEAQGCAITFSGDKLVDLLVQSLQDVNKGETMEKIRKEFKFYQVAYIRHRDNSIQVHVSGTETNNLELLLKDLRIALRDVRPLSVLLLDRLAEIAFLFKTSEYQHEGEVRLALSGLGFEPKVDDTFTPPKVYIELVPVAQAISKVTLGPKVALAEEWAAAFYYSLKGKNSGVIVEVSRLPYK